MKLACCAVLLLGACGGGEIGSMAGVAGSGAGSSGAGVAGTPGASGTGPAGTTGSAGASGTAGASGIAGQAGSGAAGQGTAGGGAGRAGGGGAAGAGPPGTAGSGAVITSPVALDCGPLGWTVENHGPPANRVNYVILGDGYVAADLGPGGKFEQHINATLARRFGLNGEVYGRYRNFVNICGIKLVSAGPICGSSALGCCGDDQSRLAKCTMGSVNAAFAALPASLSLDWRAVMLNGASWWNTGSATMLWSGGHADAAGAALHEGGHGFHQLADEYGTCTGAACGSNTMSAGTAGAAEREVNSAGNPTTTDGKWDRWIGFDQVGATGLQGTWLGSRYLGAGQYRPSANSMMNSLFCRNGLCSPNTSFNAVSREQMIMSIWRVVRPIDSTEPPAGSVNAPATLKVNVVDPAVISVDWSVDGTVMRSAGVTFDTSGLPAGTHTISATAYDNAGMDLVRYRDSACPTSVTGTYCHRTAWKNSTQTVVWTVTR